MNGDTTIPKDFDLELLEAQGGNISPDHFSELLFQLEKSGSFDHASQQALVTSPGELDIVYIVLCKGYLYELSRDGFPQYTCVSKNGADYWLAGFGSLRVSQTGSGGENTAEILVSFLPRAQKKGYGSFLVRKLIQYAFDTYRGGIYRVTAPIVCPVQPHYTAAQKKRVVFNTKQLCWMFEKFGFKFEGITRGVVESLTAEGGSVWHDVHRMSILDTDYLEEERSHILSNTRAFHVGAPKTSPWESMIQRQQEEKRDLESWTEKPTNVVLTDEAYNVEDQVDDESDDETVLGGGDDSDWEVPVDFEG